MPQSYRVLASGVMVMFVFPRQRSRPWNFVHPVKFLFRKVELRYDILCSWKIAAFLCLYHLPCREILPFRDNILPDYTDHQQILSAKPFEIVNPLFTPIYRKKDQTIAFILNRILATFLDSFCMVEKQNIKLIWPINDGVKLFWKSLENWMKFLPGSEIFKFLSSILN